MNGGSPVPSRRDEPAGSEAPQKTQLSLKGRLNVRLFVAEDIPTATLLIKQHHNMTLFRGEQLSERKLNQHFQLILSRPAGMIGMAVEYDEKVVGLAWASASGYMLTDGPPIVSISLIAVDLDLPAGRRVKAFLSLISSIRQWSKNVGARDTLLHVTTGFRLNSTDRLIKASGGILVGGNYLFS